MRISPIYNAVRYVSKTARKKTVKQGKVKDVTPLYKNVKLKLRGN